MFQQPGSAGDQLPTEELVGALCLFEVHEVKSGLVTRFSKAGETTEAVLADVHSLAGPHAGESFENVTVWGRALVPALRHGVGADPVLGRIELGMAKNGNRPPYVLAPFTEADAALATQWLTARASKVQAPATVPAQAPAAVPAAAAALSPAAVAAGISVTPAAAPAAPAAVPAGPAGQLDVSTLTPDVLELLRQSGALPGA